MTPEEERECRQHLDNISDSQASIQIAKEYMMKQVSKAGHMLTLVHQKYVALAR